MKKIFFVSIISLLLVTNMRLSFAQDHICRNDFLFGQSGILLADAIQTFAFGDTVIVNDDGSATVTDRYGNVKRQITADELLDGNGGYVARLFPRGDGLQLLRNNLNDLKALVGESASLCEFEPTGFTCAVKGYYCACYYGDPDGTGASCSCGSINDNDSCL